MTDARFADQRSVRRGMRSLAVLMAIPWLISGFGPAAASELVPFVGCPGEDQSGEMQAPVGDAKPLSISHSAARHLAYYADPSGGGVLAPRGWHCLYRTGSSGSSLKVTQNADDALRLHAPVGPAVVFRIFFGNTSGRVQVAWYFSRLFPKLDPEYVQAAANDGSLPEDLPANPYRGDAVKYRSKRIAEFRTPANRDGLGTSADLMKSADPIRGIAQAGQAEAGPYYAQLSVRLPRHLRFLESSILSDTERCMKLAPDARCRDQR